MRSIILGVIQGLTEFLPVSSSGHLVLAQRMFGLIQPEIFFDAMLHLGTLLAVIIVYRIEIVDLARELVLLPSFLAKPSALKDNWESRPQLKMLAFIFVGTLGTGVIWIFVRGLVTEAFGSGLSVSAALIVTGVVLFSTRKGRKKPDQPHRPLGVRLAFIIGLAQGLALFPGISRSGLTISVGLLFGLDRNTCARYSFILSIPAILAAVIVEAPSMELSRFSFSDITVGLLAAFVSGTAALMLLLNIVRSGKLHYFSYYCWTVGFTGLGYYFFGAG